MRLVILTGASGSGKTTIAEAIRLEWADLIDVLHVDRIGVPSVEAMTAGWGSPDAWQRAMTLDWMRRLAESRGQPELASPDMMAWAAFLRREAQAAGCAILDTSHASLEACVERVAGLLMPPTDDSRQS